MKLTDVVKQIDSIDEDLILFQKDSIDFNSEIRLLDDSDADNGIRIVDGNNYHYLIEVFLAKEFIEDWIENPDYIPDDVAIAKRLFEYCINDA